MARDDRPPTERDRDGGRGAEQSGERYRTTAPTEVNIASHDCRFADKMPFTLPSTHKGESATTQGRACFALFEFGVEGCNLGSRK